MGKLAGQTAVVTGSSSGIGKAIARAMAEDGANIVINYSSSQEPATLLAEEIKASGGKAITVQADVSKESDVKELFTKTYNAFGTIDILVNNAGIQQDAQLIDMTLQQWQQVIDINLTGQFLCAREAAREFIKRGIVQERSRAAGKIICISSVHDVIPWAGHINYAASKGGVMMLMKTLAQELAPYNIRVNSISPGAIKTRINEENMQSDAAVNKILSLIPYNRLGIPDDIGKVAVWLASDDADYLTGTTLYVDGGMTLYPGFAGNG